QPPVPGKGRALAERAGRAFAGRPPALDPEAEGRARAGAARRVGAGPRRPRRSVPLSDRPGPSRRDARLRAGAPDPRAPRAAGGAHPGADHARGIRLLAADGGGNPTESRNLTRLSLRSGSRAVLPG